IRAQQGHHRAEGAELPSAAQRGRGRPDSERLSGRTAKRRGVLDPVHRPVRSYSLLRGARREWAVSGHARGDSGRWPHSGAGRRTQALGVRTMKPAIDPDTTVGALLDAYPEAEAVLIDLAPAFAKLRNPVVRRTVAKVATLEHAAKIGGVSLRTLIGKLRE